jgi:hypothetical protein
VLNTGRTYSLWLALDGVRAEGDSLLNLSNLGTCVTARDVQILGVDFAVLVSNRPYFQPR